MAAFISIIAIFIRVFRKPSNPLYDPARKQGYWVVRYRLGWYNVLRWNGRFWWDGLKKDYRPFKVIRYIGRATAQERGV